MRFTGKCFAIAISALFAITPVVPAEAMPVTKVQARAVDGNVQLVQNSVAQEFIRRERGRNYNRGSRDRSHRWDRGSRSDRRWNRDRNYRSDRGYYRGHRGYRHARRGYRHHNGYWFPLAAFGAGAVIGGAIANDRGYTGGGSHVNWCANRYRSYRAYDNTYQPYGGPRRQCASPYR